MATQASTNITTAIAVNGEQPLAWGDSGLIMEVFKAVPGAADDTVAITPRFISDIRMVESNLSATDTLSQTAANTNVTLTLKTSTATGLTFQVRLIGRR